MIIKNSNLYDFFGIPNQSVRTNYNGDTSVNCFAGLMENAAQATSPDLPPPDSTINKSQPIIMATATSTSASGQDDFYFKLLLGLIALLMLAGIIYVLRLEYQDYKASKKKPARAY